MAELSLKELKAVLDDNELDLSMRQLSIVPVKALSKLPRATHLDFSNNKIVTIPLDFCLLTHITKLDLSNNRIVQLPENFGKLVNLVHLDLYKNCIEELPLSFGELTNLKWLDMKGNPLDNDLEKAAGDCQDENGCRQAAVRVVRLMREKTEEQQRLIQKQKALNKLNEKTNAPQDENIARKQKAGKKKRNKNKDAVNVHAVYEEPVKPNEVKAEIVQNEKPKQRPIAKPSRSFFSMLFGFLWKFLLPFVVFLLIGSGIATFIIIDNCTEKSHRWIPLSQPFCNDLRKALSDYKITPTFWTNLQKTLSSMLSVYGNKLREFWSSVQETKYGAIIDEYFNAVYTRFVAAAFLSQKYAFNAYEAARKWYLEKASDSVISLIESFGIGLKIALAMLSDLALFLIDKGSTITMAVYDNVLYYAEHREELLNLVRHWWQNMK